MTGKGPENLGKNQPKSAPKAVALPTEARSKLKASRSKFTKKFDLTKKPKAAPHKPEGFHRDRLYRREYSKLIRQSTQVDGLRLTPLADLLKAKEVVVVTTQGEKFGLLPFTDSSPHIRPYALEVMRSIAKEFYEKSGGYQLLVSSLFRTP